MAASSALALSSASSPRAQITSRAPSSASAWAVARPRPLEAAVTSATLPETPKSMGQASTRASPWSTRLSDSGPPSVATTMSSMRAP